MVKFKRAPMVNTCIRKGIVIGKRLENGWRNSKFIKGIVGCLCDNMHEILQSLVSKKRKRIWSALRLCVILKSDKFRLKTKKYLMPLADKEGEVGIINMWHEKDLNSMKLEVYRIFKGILLNRGLYKNTHIAYNIICLKAYKIRRIKILPSEEEVKKKRKNHSFSETDDEHLPYFKQKKKVKSPTELLEVHKTYFREHLKECSKFVPRTIDSFFTPKSK